MKIAVQVTIEALWSVLVRPRTVRVPMALQIAQASALPMPMMLPLPSGCATTSTPTNPTLTAIQRAWPTRSLSIG